ncbi:RNA methyltransferase PUA domain-containing protein [Methylomonas koyamae]|uniref:RNA methyltransferase PUA domain-containing protein n=1 Tax=Methylomonas koyamae TaxID=702114 RepID=UPI000AC1B0FF|nr:RNA methyltransferase PUA domain-containing protein [Methylomonas koyamae]
MRVSRLYVDVALNVGQQVELNDAAGHYLRTVLRLKRDQGIILFNGRCGEYRCRLDEVSRKRVSVAVEQFIDAVSNRRWLFIWGWVFRAATGWIGLCKKRSSWVSPA